MKVKRRAEGKGGRMKDKMKACSHPSAFTLCNISRAARLPESSAPFIHEA
jgi:hypothetical protein